MVFIKVEPSGYVKSSYWKWPMKIVDLPSYKMVDLSIAMFVYQRVKLGSDRIFL